MATLSDTSPVCSSFPPLLVYSCTLSLCYLGSETDDYHINPNINTEIINWLLARRFKKMPPDLSLFRGTLGPGPIQIQRQRILYLFFSPHMFVTSQ